jgi:hypothetical protein
MRGAKRSKVPSGGAAIQLPWTQGRIRLKNTREGGPPTSSNQNDGNGFASWIVVYREQLGRFCQGADHARRESTQRKGKV